MSSRFRVAMIGNSAALIPCARIFARHHDIAAFVTLPAGHRPNNSADYRPIAAELGAEYREFADINAPESLEYFRAQGFDVIFSMWPHLIDAPLIATPGIALIGTHCTALPLSRGRHPLHWSIVLGIERTCMSFFRMDEGVDTGNVIAQVPFEIPDGADINAANAAMQDAAERGCALLAETLAHTGRLDDTPQDHGKATYWRKRSVFDTIIDPRMGGGAIARLVRSFCPPYPCAKLIFRGTILPISACEHRPLAAAGETAAYFEHGRILECGEQTVTLRVDDGIVTLHAAPGHDLRDIFGTAKHIHPPARYLCEHRELLDRLLSA